MEQQNSSFQGGSSFQNPMSVNMNEIVKQLADLVHLVLECEKKELAPNISFVEVNQQLLILRNAIDLLNKSYVQTLHSLSLSENEIEHYRKNIEELKGPERQLLVQLNQLQNICKEARDRVDASLRANLRNPPSILQFPSQPAQLNEKQKPKRERKSRISRKAQKRKHI